VLDPDNLPREIKYNGQIKTAIRYSDTLGGFLIITTETGIFQREGNQFCDAELFAYQYSLSGDNIIQTWEVYDQISNCPADIGASLINNTIRVTDLDKTG
jgi:hypothetical protein